MVAVNSTSFDDYNDLFEYCASIMIAWSEGELLAPEYLHLHEEDIGAHLEYEMWKYLRVFVTSLGGLRKKIKNITFCYSYEENNDSYRRLEDGSFPPRYFYKYSLYDVQKTNLDSKDFTSSGIPANIRPTPISLKENLLRTLKNTHWLQPYFLKNINDEVIHSTLLERTSAESIEAFKVLHEDPSSYQFSLYGFELLENQCLSEAEQRFLQTAFLIHIWTWNHDLRATHALKQHVTQHLPEGKKAWAELNVAMSKIFDKFQKANLSLISYEDKPIIPLKQDYWDSNASSSLFTRPHASEDWLNSRSESQQHFVDFIKKCFSIHEARRLKSFLKYSGWHSDSNFDFEDSTIRNHALLTWASIKQLTRIALERREVQNPNLLSFSQIVNTILFALDRSEAHDVEVSVIKVIKGTCTKTEDVANYLSLIGSNKIKDDEDWFDYSKSAINGEEISMQEYIGYEWNSTRIKPEVIYKLESYLKSGMPRTPSNIDESLSLALPKPSQCTSEFLNKLYELTRAFCAQTKRSEIATAQIHRLEKIILTQQGITIEKGRTAWNIKIEYKFSGQLPNKLFQQTAGEIAGRLTSICNYFRFDKVLTISGESLDPGVFHLLDEGSSVICFQLQCQANITHES